MNSIGVEWEEFVAPVKNKWEHKIVSEVQSMKIENIK